VNEHELIEPFLLVALAILAAMLITKGARKIGIPPSVGFLLFGVGLRALDSQLDLVSEDSAALLALLGELGVAALLFRVGLESDMKNLLAQLPRALLVWVCDVGLSATFGFVVAWLWGLELVPSLFVAVAFSATSIGLSVAVWEDARALSTPLGGLLVDVAELDDISAVLLTSLIIVIAPALHSAGGFEAATLGWAVGGTFLRILVFGVGCWLFSRYLERRLTRLFVHRHVDSMPSGPTPVLFLVGTGFAIAALAGMLGLSIAVGALFAGLMFSRDPEAVRVEHSFEPIHALFTPFFFLDIGFAVDVGVLGGAAFLALILLAPAVLGKLLGVGGIVAKAQGWRVGTLMGVSMIPRAEIALVVARLGNRLGDWAVSDALYGAIVLISVTTAVVAPLVLQRMFKAWPELVNKAPMERPDPRGSPDTDRD
jgi:Kef-type K+ transport system membrane component KefB